MVRKSLHETTFPRVKKYMSETDKAVTVKDVAQFLDMSVGGTNNVMLLMEVFKMVQKVKRGKNYYFLKDVYDDEQIEAMLPPKKVALIPRRRRPRRRRSSSMFSPKLKRQRSTLKQSPPPADDSFMKEYLSAVRVEPGSGGGLTALSMIGFPQEERAEEISAIDNLDDIDVVDAVAAVDVGSRAPIRVVPFATVEYLPKEVRLLNSGEARYLKDQLRALRGFEFIEDLGTVFAKFSALEKGRYGNVLYFSLGTNQWDYVKKVTIDRSISDFIVLPSIERNRWASWNHFIENNKETRDKYGRKEYDKIIDQFMESGHHLVEITVENRGVYYVKNVLSKRIIERELEEQVKASRVDEWIYLERVESK
ncbi:hypothetical protein ES703_82335 [subsurface metagenome]